MSALSGSSNVKHVTTIIAIFFAFLSGMANMMMAKSFNKSILSKNEVAILESQIGKQWNYFSEKSIRMDIALLAKSLNKPMRAKTTNVESIEFLDKKRTEIFNDARSLEQLRGARNQHSEYMNRLAHTFASSVALLQIAVMLISFSSLTISRMPWISSLITGSAGTVFFMYGIWQYLMFR